MKKYIFILSVLQIAVQAQNFDIKRYESTIQRFEKQNDSIVNALATDLVVLYGSSSFALWKNYKADFAPYNVINRGFGGSTGAEAIYYFERAVLPLKPKVIFWYEGENDLASGFSLDSTFSNFVKMSEIVKQKLPNTYFIPLSIKLSPSRKNIREFQKTYNGMVRGICKTTKKRAFVDITRLQFKPDGNIDPQMFENDSLHVSEIAYKKWATRMKQQLELALAKPKKENWNTIFNGKNLDGWEQRGGNAKYEVMDGTVIGTSTLNTPNSFMCTKKMYKDFILEFEVKVDTNLNSGVQFRSNSKSAYREGVVHGYQCEIDPSKRAYSGGIYDEQRRGWLYNPESDPYAKQAFNRYGWNKYRVEAVGYSIKTYVNGIQVSDIIDMEEASGFIGLQVHSISKEVENNTKVMWKNIRISEF